MFSWDKVMAVHGAGLGYVCFDVLDVFDPNLAPGSNADSINELGHTTSVRPFRFHPTSPFVINNQHVLSKVMWNTNFGQYPES